MPELQRLSPVEADRLRAAPWTYAEVGGSAGTYPTGLPAGYRLARHREVVGHGDEAFDRAVERLLTWRMHLRAGLHVAASAPRAEEGAVLVQRLGVGPLALRIPCRVVYLIDRPEHRGFAYGTLPGHPESGEERFEVARAGPDVVFTVTAFARPGRLLTRLGGPLSWRLQEHMLRRYAAALR